MKLATRIFKRTDWYVTSPFGWRSDPFTGKKTFHAGTDYGTNCEKWGQYALEDGYVLVVRPNSTGGYGNYLWVRYPRLNISLMHAHLNDICVVEGQKVNSDTLLGHTGQTGKATGIHLHLGMTLIGSSEWLDPQAYDYIPPEEPTPTPTPTKIDIEYQVYDNVEKRWLGIIKNYNNKDIYGYAGIMGHSIGGIRVRVSDGQVTVRSHIKGGYWQNDITKWDDTKMGYSGILGCPIDKYMVETTKGKVHYRCHVKGGNWCSWIDKYEPSDPYGYSGITGREIDAIQMYVE